MLGIRDSIAFPADKQEKFSDIKSRDGYIKCRNLSFSRKVSGAEGVFKRIKKSSVNSRSNSLSSRLGDVRERRLPCEICFFQFQHDWHELLLRNCRGRGTFREMNRIGMSHSYDDIISADNLLDAWKEFLKGKQKKKDVQAFEYNLIENISMLRSDLVSGKYRHGSYTHFKISDPKPRDIHKASVRDRLVHHAVYRVLYPFFDRKFINDSYSCRLGKGTHRAMNAFRQYAYRASENHAKTLWILKCDIKKFFASIDQQLLLDILKQYLSDERTIKLLQNIIESFRSTALGKGLPLGNLTSQLLVNICMNEFDQFAKHRLKARYYIRYSDDFVILSTDREWLISLLPRIRDFLHENLKLELHPNKVSVSTLASGVDFLGWVHFPDHRILRTSTKRRMLKAVSGSPNEATLMSYRGMLKHGNAHKLSKLIPTTTSA